MAFLGKGVGVVSRLDGSAKLGARGLGRGSDGQQMVERGVQVRGRCVERLKAPGVVDEALGGRQGDDPQVAAARGSVVASEHDHVRQVAGGADRQCAGEPALLEHLVAVRAGLPDVDGAEMRAIGPGIADALYPGELSGVPGGHQWAQRGVQAKAIVQVEDAGRRDGEIGAQAGVFRIREGDQGIESVVAAFELDQDERSAVLRRGRLRRGDGRRGHGHRGECHAQTGQAQEVATVHQALRWVT